MRMTGEEIWMTERSGEGRVAFDVIIKTKLMVLTIVRMVRLWASASEA